MGFDPYAAAPAWLEDRDSYLDDIALPDIDRLTVELRNPDTEDSGALVFSSDDAAGTGLSDTDMVQQINERHYLQTCLLYGALIDYVSAAYCHKQKENVERPLHPDAPKAYDVLERMTQSRVELGYLRAEERRFLLNTVREGRSDRAKALITQSLQDEYLDLTYQLCSNTSAKASASGLQKLTNDAYALSHPQAHFDVPKSNPFHPVSLLERFGTRSKLSIVSSSVCISSTVTCDNNAHWPTPAEVASYDKNSAASQCHLINHMKGVVSKACKGYQHLVTAGIDVSDYINWDKETVQAGSLVEIEYVEHHLSGYHYLQRFMETQQAEGRISEHDANSFFRAIKDNRVHCAQLIIEECFRSVAVQPSL